MAASRLGPVIHRLRRAVGPHDGVGVTDGRLLERFLADRDAAAFEALVRRHGPMVWGVCRRVMGDGPDAEDAFQATFLVLVRKAASVSPPDAVGHWLYGVARTTAVRARAANAKRRVRERGMSGVPEPQAGPPDPWADLRPLLDRELARLPDRYRAPVVLCDLQGRARREVARHLGIPEGTLSSRLTAARRLLARRLSRHGPPVAGGLLAAVLSREGSACVPASVVSSTVRAATLFAAGPGVAAGAIPARVAALTEGVVKAMALNKLRAVMAVLLLLGLAGLGGGLVQLHTAGAEQGQPPSEKAGTSEAEVAGDAEVRVRGEPSAYDALFDKALGAVGDHFAFRFAYASRFEGRIETPLVTLEPRTGPSIRRRAVVQILPLEGGGFSVKVRVSREVEGRPGREGTWQPVGRDTELEQRILKRLAMRAAGERMGGPATPRQGMDREDAELGVSEGSLLLRTYAVGDLVGKDADSLIRVITRSVEPTSWAEVGGRGTVEYFPLGKALVINQSTQTHGRVRSLLDALRKLKADQDEEPQRS